MAPLQLAERWVLAWQLAAWQLPAQQLRLRGRQRRLPRWLQERRMVLRVGPQQRPRRQHKQQLRR
jgi:hypothetical protein